MGDAMKNENRRRFSRIHMQWAIKLNFGLTEYKGYIGNISLTGLYVKGNFNQSIGDLCTIKLKRSGLFKESAILAVGSISRCTGSGIAIEFTSMKLDSFFFLQSSLLHKMIDPSVLGKEFVMNDFCEIDGDLVFFTPTFSNESTC
ncbi:MAG: PilZ domain-containing protein [Candidatus Electrothrix sp. AR4]|nr:PilZ domain-containing protein [Candidatus Electrothrix sp. AR4]